MSGIRMPCTQGNRCNAASPLGDNGSGIEGIVEFSDQRGESRRDIVLVAYAALCRKYARTVFLAGSHDLWRRKGEGF